MAHETHTVDRHPENPQPCCILCSKWICHECWDWHRNRANRFSHQYCPNCGGVEGQFIAVRHTKPHGSGRVVVPRRVPTELPATMEEMQRIYFYL